MPTPIADSPPYAQVVALGHTNVSTRDLFMNALHEAAHIKETDDKVRTLLSTLNTLTTLIDVCSALSVPTPRQLVEATDFLLYILPLDGLERPAVADRVSDIILSDLLAALS